jgi:hypothetical protein
LDTIAPLRFAMQGGMRQHLQPNAKILDEEFSWRINILKKELDRHGK